MSDPLSLFLPPVREWFRKTLGEPTAAQRLGWPAIASGQNTLILAPTGSGKTLAAFLACLDGLWRQDPCHLRVCVLYVSPLKAAPQRHSPPAGASKAWRNGEGDGGNAAAIEAAVRRRHTDDGTARQCATAARPRRDADRCVATDVSDREYAT
jgi:hypothetical protein